MVKYLPENLILKTHKNLLVASGLTCFTFPLSVGDNDIKKVIKKIKGSKFVSIQPNKKNKKVYFTAPDFRSQKDGVDMAYKLGGKYSAEKLDINSKKLEEALDRMAEIVPKSL
jgi:copper chaperone CopZ